ncbi:MAG: hypothetical protein JWP49_2782 [Phenylobacterium sp.]|jgi:hypothetical protein|nr:hypothetical protein [Phenylobacterium sp.]
MTPDRDFSPKPQSQSHGAQSYATSSYATSRAAPLDDDARAAALFQEINARRARVENTELLRHLRGL